MPNDDDDFEPAITEGMEPELRPGDANPGLDDDLSPEAAEEVAFGSQHEGGVEVVGKRGHPKSQKTRELLRKAVEDLKAQRDAGELDEDDLEYDEDEKPAPGERKAVEPPNSKGKPAAEAAPVPALDPKNIDREADYAQRVKDLEARESTTAERERASDLIAFGEAWIEGRTIDALRAILKGRGIAETDEDWKDHAAELITDLSEKVFGTKVDPTLKTTIEGRRTKRLVMHGRRQNETQAESLKRERLEQQQEQQWASARSAVGRELDQPAHRQAYPFLTSLDNAAQVVMEWAQKETNAGRRVTWQEAAKAANDYIHDQASKHAERWRPLLEQVSRPKPNGQQRTSGRPPGTSQVSVAPQPTTEQQAVQPKPKPVEATNGRNWNETHRKNTKRMMRAAFKSDD